MALAKHVKFREEQFGGVLFQTVSEKVYTLNPCAAAIIREVAAGRDLNQIMQNLKAQFVDPNGTIEADVAALIGQLREKGLVEDAAA